MPQPGEHGQGSSQYPDHAPAPHHKAQGRTAQQYPHGRLPWQMLGQGLAQPPGPHVRRAEEQAKHRCSTNHRRQDQQRTSPPLHQHPQGAELQQQRQRERDYRNRATAWIFHDPQGPLPVAEAAKPGIGAVGQAIQVQCPAEHHPEGQQ
ncbi:hypothetical protein D3C76_796910 [compost metagenome]